MAKHALTSKELQWVMRQTSDPRLVAVASLHPMPASSEQAIRDQAEQAYRLAPHDQRPDVPLAPAVQLEILHHLRKRPGVYQPPEIAAASSLVMPPVYDVITTASTVLHILVVDDVAMSRDFASCFLRAAGHTVTCVESGAEAIAAAEVTDFNVVLMDVRMPEMNGLEATRRIRALKGIRGRVPIVALTAIAFVEQVAECRKAGMDSHVSKPFDPRTLLTAVLRAVAAGPTQSKDLVAEEAPTEQVAPARAIGATPLLLDRTALQCSTSYLTSDALNTYLCAFAEQGEAFLQKLRDPHALSRDEDEVCETAQTIAGNAGMFGFDRLTYFTRRLETAIQLDTTNVPALVDAVRDTLEETLQVIYDRRLVTVGA